MVHKLVHTRAMLGDIYTLPMPIHDHLTFDFRGSDYDLVQLEHQLLLWIYKINSCESYVQPNLRIDL